MMDRVARTIEIHRELVSLWGLRHTYNLTMAIIYPPGDAYAAIKSDEIMSGTDQDIPIKRIVVTDDDDDFYAPITVYRRKV